MVKQAVVVRKDVKMDKGKLAVQVAHASVSSALLVQKKDRGLFESWMNSGQKKVALKVEGEKELFALQKKAASIKVTTSLIKDAGLTQLEPGTTTALGIGPDEDKKIDSLVSSLKLL